MEQNNSILRYEERAVFALRNLYQKYGYRRYKMSRFEEYELYARNKDFLVSGEVITFTDRTGRLLAMKPDVTLSIIKNSADHVGMVEKQYYNENVYRIDPGTHSFKEIMQAGLECIGDLTSYEICEVVMLAVKSLALLGKDYVLDVSHMGLISSVLDSSGLSQNGKKKAEECLRQKNIHELDRVCSEEKLNERAQQRLRALVNCCGSAEKVKAGLSDLLESEQEKKAMQELELLFRILTDNGYADSVRVDFSVGNDMKYYSGVVFKGYLEGVPTSVLSGGQYDKLLQKMGRTSSAIGFAIYLDLLERLDNDHISYDVDMVLLHDGSSDTAKLTAAAEIAAQAGSVLVTTVLPEDRTWKKLIRFVNGEAVNDEENG